MTVIHTSSWFTPILGPRIFNTVFLSLSPAPRPASHNLRSPSSSTKPILHSRIAISPQRRAKAYP